MNEGQTLHTDQNHNNSQLVRRPSSAVEKASSGGKRILSDMVADTLIATAAVLLLVSIAVMDIRPLRK